MLGPIVPVARTPGGNVVVWDKAVGKNAAATAPAIAREAERILKDKRRKGACRERGGVVDKGIEM